MLARGDAGGYIVPAARRAELVVSLAIRNLTSYCGGLIASGPDTYFRLIAAGSGAPIYRSEVARQTCNPSWLPIDWAQVTQDAHHRDERLKLNTVRIQVLLAARRSRPWDAVPEPAAGRAFFEAAGLLDAADVPALDIEIDLRTLRFIGADALGVLSSIGSAEGGAAGAFLDGGGADGVAAAVLPLNAVVLQLEDGYYTPQTPQSDNKMDGVAAVPSPSGGLLESLALAAAGVAVGSPGGGALSPTARYDMRRSFDAINRLMQLRRDTGTAHAAARDAATTLAATLAPGLAPHAANALSVELLERTARVGALRRKRDAARDTAAAARKGVEAAHAALVARAQALKRAGEGLRDLSDALPFMATAVEEVRGEVSLLRTLITSKQLSLVAELRALYPIQEAERGRQYTIRGLSMPHRDSFGALRVRKRPV